MMTRSIMFSLVLRLVFLNLLCSLLVSSSGYNDDGRKVYIVYMGSKPNNSSYAHLHHRAMLEEVVGSTFTRESLVYSYTKSFNGFAVKLTEEEAERVADKEGVVSVFPSLKNQLFTTRSWDFMAFPENVPRVRQLESNMIIGVIDSGIWPDSPSFSDKTYTLPPTSWRGTCETSANFRCNRKIIGARAYRHSTTLPPTDRRGPIDTTGHGTIVASIAAGGAVKNANLYGLGLGTARGGVPSARISVYKVCWSDGCDDADVLAGFDQAIADGVHILSVSFGELDIQKPYFMNAVAIGTFQAMRAGILTSTAVGNAGPSKYSAVNIAPWALSVAASTIDRDFIASVKLGNGQTYQGRAVNTFDPQGEQPLVYAGKVPNIAGGYNSDKSRYCIPNSVNQNLVKGKIVVCDMLLQPVEFASLNGAVGVVMQSDILRDFVNPFPLPTSHFDSKNGNQIKLYEHLDRNPTATISKSVAVKDLTAPVAADFSSRGPNGITPTILKPDLTAPGVNILGAWPLNAPISDGVIGDKRLSPYNFRSGTSFACPHVTAIAVYIKTFNPTWSPAAVKSALMTTALPMDARLHQGTQEFAYGSGHIDPLNAVNPGLVYDAAEMDYIRFLCGIPGFTTDMLRLITFDNTIDCTGTNIGRVNDLNYPSFAVPVNLGQSFNEFFPRVLTNVEARTSTYTARIEAPAGFNIAITVNPPQLTFDGIADFKSYRLTVQGSLLASNPLFSASLVWSNGEHNVRSPIVVFPKP